MIASVGEDLLRAVLQGAPPGTVYALVALGFVLAYKTSGVFNLAFGAQAYVSAVVFFKTHVEWEWGVLPSFLVSVVVLAPLLGVVLEFLVFRHLRTRPPVAGLVVAIARPDVTMTLVEPLLRRTTFLDEVVAELGLDHVEVVRGRADDLHGHRTFDVVTSRAVAPLDRLLGWSMPLVAPTGALVAMKGRSVHEEIDANRDLLRTWRCGDPEVIDLGDGIVDPQTTVLRVSWADPTRIGWPLARGPERGRQAPTKRRRPRREVE